MAIYYETYDEETQKMSIEPTSRMSKMMLSMVSGTFFERVSRKIKNIKASISERISRIFRNAYLSKLPIVPNRILFATFQNSYTCNEKYIAEELIRRNVDCEIIFMVDKGSYNSKCNDSLPPQVKMVRRNFVESLIAISTSKIWIDNALNVVWKPLPKKKGQIYLNTWHGSLGIKVLGGPKNWIKIAKKCDSLIDYFITNSTFEENVYRDSFWPNVPYLKYGHPRNDVLFDQEKMSALKAAFCEENELPLDTKFVLYAPTFRDGNFGAMFNLDVELLRETLTQKFGGDWKVILKAHPRVAKSKVGKRAFANLSQESCLNMSSYGDIQDLIAFSDIAITDFSSWIFDFCLTGRPGFIYAEDIEKYVNDRGFYYSLSETPFPVSASNEELMNNIMKFNSSDYDKNLQDFLADKGCYEDGHAAERTVDFIIDVINSGKEK